jgi:hypothetical protein
MRDYVPVADGVETTQGDVCFIRYPIPGNAVNANKHAFYDWFSLFVTAAGASKASKDFTLLPSLPLFSLPFRMCSIHRGLYVCWLRYVHSRAGATESERQRSSAINLLGYNNVVFPLPDLFPITENFDTC